MPIQIALAVFLSIGLIGGATFQRLAHQSSQSLPTLVSVEPFPTKEEAKEAIEKFLEPKSESDTTPSSEPLTSADLIGRQLILDYIGLAADGQAGDQTIQALADKYVASIPLINKPEVISATNLKVVTNTQANLKSYTNYLLNTYRIHANKTAGVQLGISSPDSLSPTFYSSASHLGQIYKETAAALKNTSVPASLALTHLQLINIYFSNATAFSAIAQMESDSAAAFAGLITINQNLDKEAYIFQEIQNIIKTNGV